MELYSFQVTSWDTTLSTDTSIQGIKAMFIDTHSKRQLFHAFYRDMVTKILKNQFGLLIQTSMMKALTLPTYLRI